jgi:hypothetical protein
MTKQELEEELFKCSGSAMVGTHQYINIIKSHLELIAKDHELQTQLELANKRAEISQDLIDGAAANANKIAELYKQNQELREKLAKALPDDYELADRESRLRGTE